MRSLRRYHSSTLVPTEYWKMVRCHTILWICNSTTGSNNSVFVNLFASHELHSFATIDNFVANRFLENGEESYYPVDLQ
jgi:hypothetical protein